MFLYLYIYIYNCMFVIALPDPTCNSEKSANGGNKQILLLLLLLLLLSIMLRGPLVPFHFPFGAVLW